MAAFKGGARARVRADPERGGDGTIKRKRLQEDCIRRSGLRGSRKQVVRFEDGSSTSSGGQPVHYIAETRVHLLFVTLSHATVTMMDGHTDPNIGGKPNKPGYLQKSLPPTA